MKVRIINKKRPYVRNILTKAFPYARDYLKFSKRIRVLFENATAYNFCEFIPTASVTEIKSAIFLNFTLKIH